MEIPITPALVDAILAAVLLESALLGLFLSRSGAARWIGPLLLHLASGAFLLLALRSALAHAPAQRIALALLASLIVHVASLWTSFRALGRSSA